MTYKELAEAYAKMECDFLNMKNLINKLDNKCEDLAMERYELEHSPFVYPEDVDAEMQDIKELIDAENNSLMEAIDEIEKRLEIITGNNQLILDNLEDMVAGDIYTEKAIQQLGKEHGNEKVSEQVIRMLSDFRNNLSKLDERYWPRDGSEPGCREELKIPEKIPEIEAIKDTFKNKHERVSVLKKIQEKLDIRPKEHDKQEHLTEKKGRNQCL